MTVAGSPYPGVCSAERLDEPLEDSVLREHRTPRVCLDQIRSPERCEHRDDEDALHPRRRDLRHVERDGQRERDVDERDEQGDADGAQGHRLVERAGEHRDDVVEGPGLADLAREAVDRPERRHEQQHERHDVDESEPEQRRAEQQRESHPRMGRKEGGARPRRSATRAELRGSRRHQPLISCHASVHAA